MASPVWIAVGSAAGALLSGCLAPALRPLFHPPAGGIGILTVTAYPKSYDYVFLLLITTGAGLGGILFGFFPFGRSRKETMVFFTPGFAELRGAHWKTVVAAGVVAVISFFAHDHPYQAMDPFHEGEHLSPASILQAGGKPYADVFFLHGFASDGGLDALASGAPPSLVRARRFQNVLDSATLALLVPVAAELSATGIGFSVAILAGLLALGAGQVTVFPYYRLAPILLSTWGILRHLRTGRPAPRAGALLAATLGILWSLETGLYALGGTISVLVIAVVLRPSANNQDRRTQIRGAAFSALAAAAAPLAILVICRADCGKFFADSFRIIPGSIDAIWSLPAPPVPSLRTLISLPALAAWIDSESARYYLPPVLFGLLAALGLRSVGRGDLRAADRMLTVAIFSFFAFRTAAGRCSWSHTRYGSPLLGVALVAFLLEPAVISVGRSSGLRRLRAGAVSLAILIGFFGFLEPLKNLTGFRKSLESWPSRLAPTGLVSSPLPQGSSFFVSAEEAVNQAALDALVRKHAGPNEPFVDFSGEMALYYLLDRPSSIRCLNVPMLAAPELQIEAMAALRRRPPAFVVLEGIEGVGRFDGVPNRARVPRLAAWIDENYPARERAGRYVVAFPAGLNFR